MISRNMVEEYQCMNSKDQTAFKRWLAINTIVGACLFALVAVVAISSSGELTTASIGGAIQHAEAK